MAETAVDFLLENLKELLTGRADSILVEKHHLEFLYKEFNFIRSFIRRGSEEKSEEFKILVSKIQESACGALENLDSLLISDLSWKKGETFNGHIGDKFGYGFSYDSFDYFSWIRDFALEIKGLQKEVMKLYDHNLSSIEVAEESDRRMPTPTPTQQRVGTPILEEDIVVGFDKAAMALMERLTTTSRKKQIEVIPIVGMAGLGKTTLAEKVYNDPFVTYHFYVRGWTHVSQVYNERELLINILTSFLKSKEEIRAMTVETLREELKRRLMGKPFLIVMDDVWDIRAWQDLRKSFPEDRNGSKIMMTTRLSEVALGMKPIGAPHYLGFLNREESWKLLKLKVFHKETCPLDLIEIGKDIAAKCQGLPLAIVVVAGILLKREKTQNWWQQVAESVSSLVVDDTERFMDILGMSYKHLPDHLKPCFLYFAVFPEGYGIPVWELTCLWVAEGFVEKGEEKSLQEVAEDYLMDLIDRSLVMVAEKRSNGGIKACRIHDMLRDLCLRKAEGKNFLQQVHRYNQTHASQESMLNKSLCFHSHGFHYISTFPCAPNVCSFISGAYVFTQSPPKSFIYKLIRVLDLGYISLDHFPIEILQLVHLRYLGLSVHYAGRLPQSISNLWNLDTFVLRHGLGTSTLPHTMWKMVNLRHLYIFHQVQFEKPNSLDHGYPFVLENLQTISSLGLSSFSKYVLASTPNLRKLGLFRSPMELWSLSSVDGKMEFGSVALPDLANLIHLQTLKMIDWCWNLPSGISEPSLFPPSLKKLTLSGSHVDQKALSALAMLINLEVLKLKGVHFMHQSWETSDGGFLRLKLLKIQDSDIHQWAVSGGHFPSLQWFVLDGCLCLQKMPAEMVDIPTLELIELHHPRKSLADSARKIQKEQQDMGNDELKIVIYGPE